MPIQVDGALLRAPCPVESCPACEPNTGSVHPNLPAKAARVEASRHCYAIKWVMEPSSAASCAYPRLMVWRATAAWSLRLLRGEEGPFDRELHSTTPMGLLLPKGFPWA